MNTETNIEHAVHLLKNPNHIICQNINYSLNNVDVCNDRLIIYKVENHPIFEDVKLPSIINRVFQKASVQK